MTAVGNLEPVLVGEVLPILREHRLVLLVPAVADALEEQQRQDVRLPVLRSTGLPRSMFAVSHRWDSSCESVAV